MTLMSVDWLSMIDDLLYEYIYGAWLLIQNVNCVMKRLLWYFIICLSKSIHDNMKEMRIYLWFMMKWLMRFDRWKLSYCTFVWMMWWFFVKTSFYQSMYDKCMQYSHDRQCDDVIIILWLWFMIHAKIDNGWSDMKYEI
jgi:hypothetical protein